MDMENLITLRDDKAVTSSMVVANVFDLSHDYVMGLIDGIKEFSDLQGCEECFTRNNQRFYYIDSDCFTVLSSFFKDTSLAIKYLSAFYSVRDKNKEDNIRTFLLATNFFLKNM